jgi:hypothetical protein
LPTETYQSAVYASQAGDPPYRVPRFLKIIAAIFILFILTVMALLIWHWPFSQARITESIETTFPVKVTYASFRATYFPHPGCVAEGVTLHWLAAKDQAPPIVTTASFQIEAHYLDLLFRPGYLSRIILKGFRVDVPAIGTPREQHSWHATPSHIRVGEVIADGAAVKIARADTNRPLVFDVHTAMLTSVSRDQPFSYYVTFHNPLPPGEITARGKFGPWNSDDPGITQLSGDTSFRNANLSVYHGVAGILSSDNHFSGPLQHVEARGDIDIPDFSVIRSRHAVHVKSAFHAFVDGTNGDVHLEHVVAEFLKTAVSARGNIAGTQGEDGKTAQLDLFVTNGHFQDVLRLFVNETKPPLNGVTSFRAHFTWPPGDSPFLQKIRLTGDFGIAGGQFTKDSTQSDVADLSDRARGEKPEDNPEDPDDIVSNLSGHVELRRAVATLSDISFEVPGALANMHGTFNLENHKVDLHGTLKTEAEFSHMTTGFKSVLLKPFNVFFKKKHAGAVVPAHLIGTYEHPETGVDIVPKGAPQQAPPAAESPATHDWSPRNPDASFVSPVAVAPKPEK